MNWKHGILYMISTYSDAKMREHKCSNQLVKHMNLVCILWAMNYVYYVNCAGMIVRNCVIIHLQIYPLQTLVIIVAIPNDYSIHGQVALLGLGIALGYGSPHTLTEKTGEAWNSMEFHKTQRLFEARKMMIHYEIRGLHSQMASG